MAFRLVGAAFTVATFPGLVVAAAVQDTVTDYAGVRTSTVGDGVDAYVANYDAIARPSTALAVTFLPVLTCTLLASTVFAVAVRLLPFWTLSWWMCSWFGLAVGVHAFPDPDAAAALDGTSATLDGPMGTLGSVLGTTARVSAVLSLVRVDALYAALLYYAVAALLLPGAPVVGVPALPFG